MIARAAVVVLVLAGAACGDNLSRDDVVVATSGTRLSVHWYRYDDGALQVGLELYDQQEHTLCAAERWTDDVVRCVPVAEDAVYVDAGCSEPIGRRVSSLDPTHFIAYDRIGGRRVPTHVYRAGDRTTRPAIFYQMLDGTCAGPLTSPDGLVYHQLTGEVDGATLLALHDDELGDGRLGLAVQRADDGLRIPAGLRDRELGLPCTPRVGPDGAAACQPTGALTASYFRDPDCEQPAIILGDGDEVPPVATVALASGCPSYRAVGAPLAGPVYRREGTTCRLRWPGFGEQAYAVDAPVALLALARTVEQLDGRRLQRIVLSDRRADGALALVDDELFDTATQATCRHVDLEDGGIRCLPTQLATATSLWTASCAIAIDVVVLAQPVCERPAFAMAITGDGRKLHAIGDRVVETLYQPDVGGCRPYAAPLGTELRALGPALHPDTFVGAVYFGER